MQTVFKKIVIFCLMIILVSLKEGSWARYYITSINMGDNLIYYDYSRDLKPGQFQNSQSMRHYYIRDIVSQNETIIFNDEKEREIGECLYLLLSPNKKSILIVSAGYPSNLLESRFYLMDILTKEARFLQKSNYVVTGPSFSPDSKSIAFYSSDPRVDEWQNDMSVDHKACALMNLNMETGEFVELSPASYILYQYSNPSWSPDGKEIAFIAQYSPEHVMIPQIYKIGVDGKNLKQLSPNEQILGGSVAWMSNGKLLFTSYGSRTDPGRKPGIYEMDTQGANIKHRLTIPVTPSAFYENIDKKSFIYNTYSTEDRKIKPFVINEQGEDVTEYKIKEIFEHHWKY